MPDRETPYSSNRRKNSVQVPYTTGPQRHHLTIALVTLLTLAYFTQLLGDRTFGMRWLALSWDRTILTASLWQLVVYPLALTESAFLSSGHRILFILQLVLPLALILGLGAQIERRIGSERLLAVLAFVTLLNALIALPLLRGCPELGQVAGGPIGLALALLSFHLFLFQDEKIFGALPTPFGFLVLSSLLITLVIIFALGFSPIDRAPGTNYFTLLPGVFSGALAVLFDVWFTRAHQKYRDHREVALVLEEVDVRAEVDRLLGKIAETGMGSLTRQEKRFLERSSRFFRPSQRLSEVEPG